MDFLDSKRMRVIDSLFIALIRLCECMTLLPLQYSYKRVFKYSQYTKPLAWNSQGMITLITSLSNKTSV